MTKANLEKTMNKANLRSTNYENLFEVKAHKKSFEDVLLGHKQTKD